MRLIDANALIQNHCGACANKEFCAEESCPYYEIRSRIEAAPTIEPEVRHGRWIEHGGGIVATCSNCNVTYRKDVLQSLSPYAEHLTRHCPNCGARMDGGADNG